MIKRIGGTPAHSTTVVVIGAGQAGLSCSYYLSRFGVEHVLLERGEVANSWRTQRWDSLRLLTPNWQSQLPGWAYSGADPDGFMDMAEVIRFLGDYRRKLAAPVYEQTSVTGVETYRDGYRVLTDRGDWCCRGLIIASGAFGSASIPRLASELPPGLRQLDTHKYRNPGQLGDGGVLVVGAAASGVQIAREVQRSGRQVTLATGEHVRMPRRYRGRDIQYWMQACGLLDEDWRQAEDLRRARRLPSAQLIGGSCGSDVDINSLRAEGVQLVGRLVGANDRRLQFSGDLANVTRLADLKLNRLLDRIDGWIDVHSGEAVTGPYRPQRTRLPERPQLEADLKSGEFETVIWATGYRPDYSWLGLPLMDRWGMPCHDGGVAALPGVYFMGLPFMRRRKSSFLHGQTDDAADICHHLLDYLGRPRIPRQIPAPGRYPEGRIDTDTYCRYRPL